VLDEMSDQRESDNLEILYNNWNTAKIRPTVVKPTARVAGISGRTNNYGLNEFTGLKTVGTG